MPMSGNKHWDHMEFSWPIVICSTSLEKEMQPWPFFRYLFLKIWFNFALLFPVCNESSSDGSSCFLYSRSCLATVWVSMRDHCHSLYRLRMQKHVCPAGDLTLGHTWVQHLVLMWFRIDAYSKQLLHLSECFWCEIFLQNMRFSKCQRFPSPLSSDIM